MSRTPVAKADFMAYFPPPEFTEEAVGRWLPRANDEWPCIYGGSLENPCDRAAIMNLTAHLIWLRVQEVADAEAAAEDGDELGVSGDVTGAVASQSAGPLSISFRASAAAASGDVGEEWLSLSPYGRKYLMLIQANAPRARWA